MLPAVGTAIMGISSLTMSTGKAARAARVSLVRAGVINGSLSISVCARISDHLATGRVTTLAWREDRYTFPVAARHPSQESNSDMLGVNPIGVATQR